MNVTSLSTNLPSDSHSYLMSNTTTAGINVFQEKTKYIAGWINAFIIILGFVTNSLILVILSRKRIGSQTTRIILMFMAATDLVVMMIEFLVHFVPYYWQWFPIFYTDLGCGFALLAQASVITSSSWYLMLMTAERFTVIYFPMKAKVYCTQKRILVTCILIPIVCMLSYCFFLIDIGTLPDESTGYLYCGPKRYNSNVNQTAVFKSKIWAWIIMYFFIPATTIVVLNSAIVVRLELAKRMQTGLTSVRVRENGQAHNKSRPGSRIFSRSTSQSTNSCSTQKLKKATILVISASVTFVILMVPRGVSTSITLDHTWNYDNDQEFLVDTITYLLQYLNHAINFFVYILVNNNFRKEIKRWRCKSRCCKSEQHVRALPSELETDCTTQTMYVHPSKFYQHSPHHQFKPSSSDCGGETSPLSQRISSSVDSPTRRYSKSSDNDLHLSNAGEETNSFLQDCSE